MPSPAYLTPPPVTTPCTETDHHYYRHHTAAGARGRKYAVQSTDTDTGHGDGHCSAKLQVTSYNRMNHLSEPGDI